jgi:NNP family nitrate/nitrite transporter-like MFS transporter
MKGTGDVQRTLSILGVLVAISALCALAARFSSATVQETAVATA